MKLKYISKTPCNTWQLRIQSIDYSKNFKTLSGAINAFEELVENKKFVPKYLDEMRYIYRRNGKWRIRKSLSDGEYHVTFSTLEDAIMERDFMESINWDLDEIE